MTITLDAESRRTLEKWQRSTTMPAAQARRSRIILLLADGTSISEIAHLVGISRHHVYKWIERFDADGVDGLVGQKQGRRPTQPQHPSY